MNLARFESPNALAVIETSFAAVLLLFVSIKHGSLWFLAAWSISGWLLLLRTHASTAAGLELFRPLLKWTIKALQSPRPLFRKWMELMENAQPSRYLLLIPSAFAYVFLYCLYDLAILLVLVCGATGIKVCVTCYFLISSFQKSLWAVSGNARHVALCVNSLQPLELVPGYQQATLSSDEVTVRWGDESLRFDDVRLSTLWSELRRYGGWSPALLVSIVLLSGVSAIRQIRFQDLLYAEPRLFPGTMLQGTLEWFRAVMIIVFALGFAMFIVVPAMSSTPVRVLLYIPACAYRLTLKATVITYWPLIWVVHRTTSDFHVVRELVAIRDSKWNTSLRWLSWAVLFTLVCKVLMYSVGVQLEEWAFAFPEPIANHISKFIQVFNVYFVPDRLPVWHIAAGANAVFSLAMYYLSDALIRRPIREGLTRKLLRAYFVCSGSLGVYVAFCNVLLTVRYIGLVKLPPPGPLFPMP